MHHGPHTSQSIVRRDALVTLLVEESRKLKRNEGWCLQTVLQALVEVREASLEVIEAVVK